MTEKKNRCKRVDVGVVYECLAGPELWDSCVYYKGSYHSSVCRWYSYGKYCSCTCQEARVNTERLTYNCSAGADK
jgi:hypothetical protein